MKQSRLESFFEPSRRSDSHLRDGDSLDSDDDAPLVQRKATSPAIGRAHHAFADDSEQCVDDATAVPRPCDIESDDDAPLVQRRSKESATGHALDAEAVESHDRIDEAAAVPPPSVVRSRARYKVTSASDRYAKRSKYEEEAEEFSDCDDEDDSDADDSFIVSDHDSSADGADLRAICDSLRNRREFVMNNMQCPQCYRLIAAISRFVADVHVAVP
jgi:hypothetical protein